MGHPTSQGMEVMLRNQGRLRSRVQAPPKMAVILKRPLGRVPVVAALITVFGFAGAIAGPVVATAGAATSASTPAAADTTDTTTTTSTTQAPTPAGGAMSLSVPALFNVKRHLVSVPKRRTTVDGSISVYVPGQTVTVRLAVGGHVFETRTLAVQRSSTSGRGAFSLTYEVPRSGQVSVVVTHAANSDQAEFSASRGYNALSERVHPGSKGLYVQLVQQRLRALHIYVPQSGAWDLHTQLAVDAYHRLIHRGHSESLDQVALKDLLNGVGRFHVRFPKQASHAEGDLSTQLLALVNYSQVQEIFPISSGKASTPTILGSHRVYYRVPGYLPDGMYDSSFFISGYAVHGYDPAPDYPASHGCMRLPIVDATTVYDWLEIGDWVDTYH
jgi:peptidoglycan hydrolase-like protein with peptidoglycan-binding domain